ncbi:hypothetical protein GCM10022267_56020 [Lentzea roselyniae]|uniref:Uncharacterized protein n=1 Tax=Lentzea roselyniae TaxID=531940 RepID=A0ABP7BJK5_9PSEU
MNMPWNLARQTAREAAKPLEAVEVALPDALGLALASGVRALASQPTCDTSAMDATRWPDQGRGSWWHGWPLVTRCRGCGCARARRSGWRRVRRCRTGRTR